MVPYRPKHRSYLSVKVLGTLVFVSLLHAAARGDTQLRVMTYNIHHGRGTDGVVDLNRIAAVIRTSGAALVSLQEVDNKTRRTGGVDQLGELARLLDMNAAFGKAIVFEGGQYGVGVLSKFPIERTKTHRLPGSDGNESRVALEAGIRLPDGSQVSFVATHLHAGRAAKERQRQMHRLNQIFTATESTRTILAGDLNASRSSPELKMLLNHWRPASLKSPAPTFPADGPRRQIDYVMLRKRDAWDVLATKVLDYPVTSDHAPLVVDLAARPDEIPRPNLTISTQQQWITLRDATLQAMQTVMGRLPGAQRRCDLQVELEEEIDCDTYLRRLVRYQSEPGSRTPAYLLIPKAALTAKKRVPAVLCLHPTDHQVGHKVVVGLGGTPNRQYAQELAQRGYVTIAPAYPQLANYHPELEELGYQSGTMKAIWDNMRAIDLVESLPFVSQDGVAVIGHSLGGHNGVYTAAFDKRIKVVVSSCGLDSYEDYMHGDIRGWTSSRYMPRMLDFAHRLHQLPFDFQHIIAALAPRDCLISAPIRDANFRWDSVDRIASAASDAYDVFHASDKLVVLHPDCEHDFPDNVRDQAYRLIDRVLGRP